MPNEYLSLSSISIDPHSHRRKHSPAMASLFSSTLLALLLSSFLPSSTADCSDERFSGGRTFQACEELDALDASLHWTHFPANGSAAFAFRVKADGWAAWGLNPNRSGMVGTQALVAVRSGTSGISVYTTSLISKRISLVSGNISLNVTGLAAERADGDITIYATLVLPGNGTTFNHTWQTGRTDTAGVPQTHDFTGEHDSSYGVLNLATNRTGGSTNRSGGPPAPPPSGSGAGADGARKMGFVSYFLLAAPVAGVLFL